MNDQLQAIYAEFAKLKNHRITWITFIAFSLAPLMGAVFMLMLIKPKVIHSPALSLKAGLMSFSPDLPSYLGILSQAVGVGGILIFGFVASWIFGREYSDRTAKDLLALPISRTKILNAKMVCYVVWCLSLAISNLIIGFSLGSILGLDYDSNDLKASLLLYMVTTLLTVPLGFVVSFLALAGKGYLAPLGFVAITLVLAQIIAATGFGSYFPWSIPGLYSGTGGPLQPLLKSYSYVILTATCAVGYISSLLWWKYADQTK